MKKLYTILLLSLYPFISGYAQESNYNFFFNSGYTYNPSIELNEQAVENSNGYLFTLGGVKQLLAHKKKSLELGFAVKSIFASGKLNGANFTASTLRLALPIKLVFPIAKKWEGATGIVIQNNVDLDNWETRLSNKFDWRYDVFGEIRYAIKEAWFLIASGSYNLGDMPDSFLINDPKVAFSVGVGKRVSFVNKRKIARKAKRQEKRKQKKNDE